MDCSLATHCPDVTCFLAVLLLCYAIYAVMAWLPQPVLIRSSNAVVTATAQCILTCCLKREAFESPQPVLYNAYFAPHADEADLPGFPINSAINAGRSAIQRTPPHHTCP